jgi:hypothetical protein
MKYFYAVLLVAAMSMFAGGDSSAVVRTNAGPSDAVCEAAMNNGASKEMLAQQGCCQKNQGVCGCRAGKIVCCDKTFSSNCTC